MKALLIKALLIGALPGLAGLRASTLTVSAAGPMRSVEAAIRNARAGDVIRVEAGVYPGNLRLAKRVRLEGSGRPVIRGDGRGSVITVTAPGCAIRGLVVEHSGGMLVDEDSGILLKSGGNRVENNELRDILFGIYLFQSDRNTVSDNVIRGRAFLELGERGAGIHIWNSSHNVILRNTITRARDGMYLQNANDSVIAGNRVFDLRYGLHYMYSNDNKFEDNQFYDNVAGAAIMYSRRIEFRHNAFVHNRGFSSFGLLFQDSDDCLAEHNTISDNGVGIFMEALRTSTFRLNLVAANDIAIQAFSSASDNTFERNNFVHNLSPLEVIGGQAGIGWSRQGVGNYWSQYDGYDLDGNGIGDVPFQIRNVFERMEGDHPRLRLYLDSPASQALAVSERIFPVVRTAHEVDPFPLMHPADLGGLADLPAVSFRRGVTSAATVLPLAMLGASVAVMARGRKR